MTDAQHEAAADERFAALAAEPFLSLATYRRNGEAVSTPVWAAPHDGRLVVWTGAESGKVKRLRHNPAVTVTPCDRRGALHGDAVPGTARIVPREQMAPVDAAMRAKYGWQFRLSVTAAAIGRLVGVARPGQVGLQIELAPNAAG